MTMSGNFAVWILSFLVVNFAGNFVDVSGGHEYRYKESGNVPGKVEWSSRGQSYGIPQTFRRDFASHEKENFMTRHLLAVANNGSKNGSSSPPVRLSRAERTSFTVGYGFVLLIGLTGNLLILVVIATNKEFHNNLNSLLCNLVVADALRMLTAIPFEVYVINRIGDAVTAIPANSGVTGDVFCKTMFALPPLFTFAFVFTLVFMTCERFVAVVFPFKAVVFKNKSKWIIIGVWISSLALEMPGLYAFKSIETNNGEHVCYFDFSPHCDGNAIEDMKCNLETFKEFTSVVVYATFVVAFLFILILHAVMVIVLYRRNAKFDSGSTRVSSNPRAISTHDVVRMLGVVSVVYVLTTLPTQMYQFGYIYDKKWLNKPVFLNFLLIFIENLHSMLNPWIYPLFVRRFGAKYAKLFSHVIRRRPGSPSEISTRSGRHTTTTHATLQEPQLSHKLIDKNSDETKF